MTQNRRGNGVTRYCVAGFLTVALALAISVRELPGQAPHRGATIAAIDSLVAGYIESGYRAGVSIAVAQGRDMILAKGYGYANLEHRVPATAETIYRVGSLTKQFTAAAIMRHVEQGKLSLDDEVTKFFPNYPTRGRAFTVHQMLTHTAGVKNYTELGLADSTFRLDLSHEQMIGLFKNHSPDFSPGENWHYTNSPFYLAGVIVEQLSGQSYAEYLEHTFFQPLGMVNSSYCDTRAVVPHKASTYSAGRDGLVRANVIDMTVPYSAGALCSTVLDLITWQRAFDAHRAVNRDSHRRMTTPARLNDGWQTTYGYGLLADEIDGLRLVGHGGEIDGGSALLMYYPDHDLIVATATNTNPSAGPSFFVLGFDIARAALGLGPRKLADMTLSESELAKYVGRFTSPAVNVEFIVQNGRLALAGMGPQPLPLKYQGNDTFLTDVSPLLRFQFEGDGWRGLLSGVTYRFSRVR